ncbi:MAG: DUF86 domain-containing protein [Proteobacteria bacterium]|nr:DUF86 domain-containing protein [Pseudomonadota bacterium]
MLKDDKIRIKHMLDAAKEAVNSTSGSTRSDLGKDHIRVLGLVKCVEIVGEAASRVGKETRDSYPEIAWNQIVAMRNRLVHVYFDIDLEQVWKTVSEDLPPLIDQLEKILGPQESVNR